MKKTAIICVDDESIVLMALKSQLKQFFGREYYIEVAESAEEALDILDELLGEDIDVPLIISDQIMPQMKGDELLIEVHKRSPETLKILLTGLARTEEVGNAVNHANLYRFILKPWDKIDLNLTVKQAINSYFQSKKLKEQNFELQELNKELEAKVIKRTEEVLAQKKIIEKKNTNITDSIRYAQEIQKAMLPSLTSVLKGIPDFFVLLKPRDIVSGDFYWFGEINDKIVVSAIDCTGHGIPGAFLSLIGNDLLNEIVISKNITIPNQILYELNRGIKNALNQEKNDNHDGMDMALCVIDKSSKILTFCGAKNSLVYIRDNEVYQIKGDRYSVGDPLEIGQKIFTNHVVSLEDNPMFYMFSDGYQDQFGGLESKKFMISKLKNTLLRIHKKDMDVQKKFLDKTITHWMKDQDQIDDILVMGFHCLPT